MRSDAGIRNSLRKLRPEWDDLAVPEGLAPGLGQLGQSKLLMIVTVRIRTVRRRRTRDSGFPMKPNGFGEQHTDFREVILSQERREVLNVY